MNSLLSEFSAGLSRPFRAFLPIHSPNFLVIGAQKCATSSLHYYLGQHPTLAGSVPKELRFFNTLRFERQGFSHYRRHFRGAGEKLYFESTPGYIYHPLAAERIFEALPSAKLIVVLREPVERAFSSWNHYRDMFDRRTYLKRSKSPYRTEQNQLYEKLFFGREQFPGLQECIDIELELMASEEALEPGILRRGLYLEQLERYWRFFPRQQILLLGFRELVSDPAEALYRIAEFLGIDDSGWNQLDLAPRNVRDYTLAMPDEQRHFLRDFYAQPNRLLAEKIGEVDW